MTSRSGLQSAVRQLLSRLAGAIAHALGGSDAPSSARAARRMVAGIPVSLVAVIAVLLASASPAFADSCQNAAFRATQGSTYLPDCRAWEQVSPVDKNGGQIASINAPTEPYELGGLDQAAASGDSAVFSSMTSFADAEGAGGAPQQYLAARSPSGWVTQNLQPAATSGGYGQSGFNGDYYAFTPDLATALFDRGCDTALPGTGAPDWYENLYLRDAATAAFHPLYAATPTAAICKSGTVTFSFTFQTATPNLDYIAVTASAAVPPEIPAAGTYLWSRATGTYRPIAVLPDGSPGSLATAGILANSWAHAISNDGRRVYWRTGASGVGSRIYLRDLQSQTTTELVRGAGGVALPPFFWDASADGSIAYVTTDASATTPDGTRVGSTPDTVPGSGQNLYRYDADTGQLTDLTPTADANVMGVLGASDDGSYVYFVANGVLATNTGADGSTASPGDCQLSDAAPPTTGRCNLYLWHDGATTFIARLADGPRDHPDVGDRSDWEVQPSIQSPGHTVRVSPDGRHLLFTSVNSLTGHDNTDASTGQPDSEVYLYDAASNQLGCVSCNPSGARPRGPSGIPPGSGFPQSTAGPGSATYQSRILSDDGQLVFFDSSDALVPQDTNGDAGCPLVNPKAPQQGRTCQDVYEWRDGVVSLVSSGTATSAASLIDASASGSDVFFRTTAELVSQDSDQNYDLYDARVDGGLASQYPPSQTPCQDDACQGQPTSAPPALLAATVTFMGLGNPTATPTPAGKVQVTRKAIARTAFTLSVKVPAAGRLTVTGSGVRGVKKSLARAGTYKLRLGLTAKAKRALRRRHRLKVKVRVAFVSASGTGSKATVLLTLKQPAKKGRSAHHARMARRDLGGVK